MPLRIEGRRAPPPRRVRAGRAGRLVPFRLSSKMSVTSLYEAFVRAAAAGTIGADILPLMGKLVATLGVDALPLTQGNAERLPTSARLTGDTTWANGTALGTGHDRHGRRGGARRSLPVADREHNAWLRGLEDSRARSAAIASAVARCAGHGEARQFSAGRSGAGAGRRDGGSGGCCGYACRNSGARRLGWS